MKRICPSAIGCGAVLAVVTAMWVTTAWAQDPSATEPAPATAPAASAAVCPQAYRIQPRNMLVYRVLINRRSHQNPNAMERLDRRELVVFNIEDDGNLVMHIGVAKESPAPTGIAVAPRPAPSARSGQRPAPAPVQPPAPAETEQEAHKTLEMTWTKHNLGSSFTRNDDGTISYRPDPHKAAYPVLPLPPEGTREKERFELTVPDIALGEDKTLAVSAAWRAAADGKVTIDGRMDVKAVPGTIPEMAVFGYDVPREAGAVTRVFETRRLAGEPPAAGETPAPIETPRPIPRERGERGERGERSPRPAVQAPARPAGPPVTNVAITLAETKPLSPQMHQALMAAISASQQGTAGQASQPADPAQEAPAVPAEVREALERMSRGM